LHRDTENGSKKFDIKCGMTEVEHSTHYPKIKDKRFDTFSEKLKMAVKSFIKCEVATHYPKI